MFPFLISLFRSLIFIVIFWWLFFGVLYIVAKKIDENEDYFFFNPRASYRRFKLNIIISILIFVFLFIFLNLSKYYFYSSTKDLFINRVYSLDSTHYIFHYKHPFFSYYLKYHYRDYYKIIELKVRMETKYSEEERMEYLYYTTEDILIILDYLLDKWYEDITRISSWYGCTSIYYKWYDREIRMCNIERENLINELKKHLYLFN